MALIRAKPAQPGYLHIIGPEHSELQYISFGLLSLQPGAAFGRTLDGQESLLVILGGQADIEAGEAGWRNVGARANVFDGKPTAVYLPPGAPLAITARTPLEAALCSAPAPRGPEQTLIGPDQVRARSVGRGSFRREIYDIAAGEGFAAERLLVGETFNGPGLWSSYPPHKHDVHQPPQESKLEEVYHFRLQPPQGFGFQRIYGEGYDESYAVQDRDTVTITRGFHPVAAAPGYQLYYLWVLAGPERIMHPRDDPDHAWVQQQL